MLKGIKVVKSNDQQGNLTKREAEQAALEDPLRNFPDQLATKKWKKQSDTETKEPFEEDEKGHWAPIEDEEDEETRKPKVSHSLESILCSVWDNFAEGKIEKAKELNKKCLGFLESHRTFERNMQSDDEDSDSETGEGRKTLSRLIQDAAREEGADKDDVFLNYTEIGASQYQSVPLSSNLELRREFKSESRDFASSMDKSFMRYLATRGSSNLSDDERMDEEPAGDNDFEDANSKSSSLKRKREEIQKNQKEKKETRVIGSCRYCIGNGSLKDDEILSLSPSVYLSRSPFDLFRLGHYVISSNDHSLAMNQLDEDQYDHVEKYMKALVDYEASQKNGVIFFELAMNFHKYNHFRLECVVVPQDRLTDIPVYFKKGLESAGSEWSTHKKIIEISKDKGGIKRQIPRKFPYFHVDFGMKMGFAQVIEDEKGFDRNFGYEILGAALDIEKTRRVRPPYLSRKGMVRFKKQFVEDFQKYDWTSSI